MSREALSLFDRKLIGPALLARALADGRPKQLWAFQQNHRARRFYERYGFGEIGRYAFRVGETIDDDRIMRLVL